MSFSDFCMRARIYSLISGTAHYVCLVGNSYKVTDNPADYYSIKYIATIPENHPSEA